MAKAKVKPSKGWENLKKILKRKIDTTLVHSALKKHALAAKKEIYRRIKDGEIKPKLAASTRADRKRRGKDVRPLWDTGAMAKGLVVVKIQNGYSLKPAGKHGPSGKSQAYIWKIHEFGAKMGNGGKIVGRHPFSSGIKSYIKSPEFKAANSSVGKQAAKQFKAALKK